MTDMPWLRLYTDTVDNEKIRLLAFEDRWHYIAILCCMQQGILKENDNLLIRKLSVKLGLQLREVEEVKRRLIEVNLIDENFIPSGWNKHQFKSDLSTDRVRKYRESKAKQERNVSETLQKRKCNVIDTDTDTDTDTEQTKTKNRTDKKIISFIKPSIQEITDYIKEKNYTVKAIAFYSFYESKGWLVGKSKMKCWKSSLTNWQSRELEKTKQPGKHSFQNIDYWTTGDL